MTRQRIFGKHHHNFLSIKFTLSIHIRLVLFYSNRKLGGQWSFKSKFTSLAQKLKSYGVKTGVVDCDNEQDLCKQRRVISHPTFRLHVGALDFTHQQGEGEEPSVKALQEFISSNIPARIQNIRLPKQLEDFVAVNCTHKATAPSGFGIVLLTSTFETSLLLKSLAHSLKGVAPVAEVRGGNDKVAKAAGLETQYPSLVGMCGGNDVTASEVFRGDTKSISEMLAFARTFQSKTKCPAIRKSAAQRKSQAEGDRKKILRLSEAQLKKMKIGELISAVESFGLNAQSYPEKSSLVEALMALKASNLKSDL